MKRKIILNSLAILVALGMVISAVVSVYYGLAMMMAGSSDCNELTNSSISCDTTTYGGPFIAWCAVTLILVVGVVFLTRLQSKQPKKK